MFIKTQKRQTVKERNPLVQQRHLTSWHWAHVWSSFEEDTYLIWRKDGSPPPLINRKLNPWVLQYLCHTVQICTTLPNFVALWLFLSVNNQRNSSLDFIIRWRFTHLQTHRVIFNTVTLTSSHLSPVASAWRNENTCFSFPLRILSYCLELVVLLLAV